jgi:hypothetical protein
LLATLTEFPPTRCADSLGEVPPPAREEAAVPAKATAAETRNRENKIRRHDGGVTVRSEFESLIIKVVERYWWFDWREWTEEWPFLSQSALRCQDFPELAPKNKELASCLASSRFTSF